MVGRMMAFRSNSVPGGAPMAKGGTILPRSRDRREALGVPRVSTSLRRHRRAMEFDFQQPLRESLAHGSCRTNSVARGNEAATFAIAASRPSRDRHPIRCRGPPGVDAGLFGRVFRWS
jgi:hypothetical protein